MLQIHWHSKTWFKLRFSGFDDEWKTYKLKDLLHNKSSSISINQLDDNVGNYPLYGASGFLKCIDFYEMDSDYISIVKDGSGVGNISFHEKNTSVVNTSQYILPKENLNIHFIFYLLQTINLNKYKTGSTIPHIYFKDYSIEKVKIPKYDEQKKIGILLKNLDAKIEILDNKLQMCQNFKKYLMQQIFTQKLRFVNYDDEWEKVRLNDCISISNLRNKNNEDIPILSVTNKLGFIKQDQQFEDRKIASNDTKNYKIVEKDDFAYNPARINVGSIAMLKNYERGIISPMYIVFKTKSNKLCPEFLEYYLETYYFKLQILKRLEGSVRLILSAESLKNIEMLLPSLKEQIKISNFLIEFDKKIRLLEKDLLRMEEYKKYLLQQMFVVRINWRCNFKLVKSPSFNKHLLILKNKIIFIIIK